MIIIYEINPIYKARMYILQHIILLPFHLSICPSHYVNVRTIFVTRLAQYYL